VTQLETITKLQTPQLLAIVAGCFEVIAGVMIAINVLPRLFSLLLIIFIGATIYYFHDFWNQAPPDNAGKLIDALKNLSLIGALFMIFGYGRGPRPVTEKTVYGDI
jgi:uncharacterized membrane protein YphA (DoxX/SURF4 family)